LQYISSEVNPPSDESDSSSAPSKEQLEQEKQLLLSFKPVMQKFLHDHVDLVCDSFLLAFSFLPPLITGILGCLIIKVYNCKL